MTAEESQAGEGEKDICEQGESLEAVQNRVASKMRDRPEELQQCSWQSTGGLLSESLGSAAGC